MSHAPPVPAAPGASPASLTGAEILFPAVPFELKARAKAASRNIQLQQFVKNATTLKDKGRVSVCRDAFGDRYDDVRKLAGQIKQHTLDHLDHYLEQFVDSATAAGVTVHFAKDAAQANAICLEIARANSCKVCVKSKSMVTEETHLLPALEAIGIETVETDLGEFIIQLDGDAPSHIVTPMIHKDRTAVARAFVRELGVAYTEDPAKLTKIARIHMRERYQRADLGISGANFLIAECGAFVLCTNEGNADLAVTVPRIHVAFVGIEKVIPRTEHLTVFLKLLARSATSQPLTIYTSLIRGPRKPTEHEGPEQVHVILIDNGRTEILREETRELLRCIRCGACLNACPVYRKAGGGHAYGAVYSGPIGATITPLLRGLQNYPDLPHASSLCGACFEACPVHIDIPTQLINLRRNLNTRKLNSIWERFAVALWTWTLKSPLRYRLASRFTRAFLAAAAEPDSAGRNWVNDRSLFAGAGPMNPWVSQRDLPAPSAQSFRDWWEARP